MINKVNTQSEYFHMKLGQPFLSCPHFLNKSATYSVSLDSLSANILHTLSFIFTWVNTFENNKKINVVALDEEISFATINIIKSGGI